MTAVEDVSAAVSAAPGLVVEDRFAIVPEWLLDADISDAAIRLYAVLLRYGQTSGARMPGRATLARRLHKKSTDSVDRAMRELEEIGAVHVEHRYSHGQRLTNLYHVKATRSAAPSAAVQEGGSRKFAATPADTDQVVSVQPVGGGRTDAARGGRTDAAGVAANLRPNPEHFTQTETPSPATNAVEAVDGGARADEVNPWREEEDRFLHSLGITDMDAFVNDVQALRADAGASTGRWSRPPLVAALQTAVRARGWPQTTAAAALKAVAADPLTRSPMRLAEAGPWWDITPPTGAVDSPSHGRDDDSPSGGDRVPLEVAEAELVEADGLRIVLQRQAREQLGAEGKPLTRVTVLRRAHQLLLATRERGGCLVLTANDTQDPGRPGDAVVGDRIQTITTAGVTGLALGAFLLSYDALHQLARTSHVPALLAWLWPLIVDGFILVASLAILDAAHRGRTARYPWLLVLAFSTLSVTFNVLHAPHHPVAQLVAAIPPLALVLSFELLMRQIHHRLQQRPTAVAHATAAADTGAPTGVPATAPAVPQSSPPAPPQQLRAPAIPALPDGAVKATRSPRAVTQSKAEAVRADCAREGLTLTSSLLADQLGISPGYARRLLRDLNQPAVNTTPERVEPGLRAVNE